jgi:hypothetical protein
MGLNRTLAAREDSLTLKISAFSIPFDSLSSSVVQVVLW